MYYSKRLEESIKNLIEGLKESNFLEENNIDDLDVVRKVLKENLIKKLIDDPYDDIEFTDEEFEKILRDIIVGDTVSKVIKKGVIKNFTDDTHSFLSF